MLGIEGLSQRKIAEKVSVSKGAVQRTLERFKETNRMLQNEGLVDQGALRHKRINLSRLPHCVTGLPLLITLICR